MPRLTLTWSGYVTFGMTIAATAGRYGHLPTWLTQFHWHRLNALQIWRGALR